MRAAIYNPYLDTLGGGERYVMTVAHVLKKSGWEVDVGWDDAGILKKLEDRLGLDLSGVRVVSSIHKGREYDLCFWLSDGSIPRLYAKKNILHFQVPFHNVRGKSLFNRLKLRRIYEVVCNSKFTKKFIDKEYGVDSVVIYPPVDVGQFDDINLPDGKAGHKTKADVILSVGRFSQLLQAKRQDVLVSVFKTMVDGGLQGWKLILVGGSDIGGEEFAKSLRFEARGYPIEIIESLDFNHLKSLYARAKIFWSASGFGVDEEKEPEKVEHFGITVVESMAAGCIPIVVNKGGFREILVEPIDNLLWNSQKALVEKTLQLINDEKRRKILSHIVQQISKQFSQDRFEYEISKITA